MSLDEEELSDEAARAAAEGIADCAGDGTHSSDEAKRDLGIR